jgi:hypothetical protein
MNLQQIPTIIISCLLLLGCSQDNEQLDVLRAENSQLTISYQEQLTETREAVTRADSLQTIVHDMEQQIAELSGNTPEFAASSAEEEAVETLVHNLHKGWTSMFKTKNTDDILKYFLPKYTASAVRIDTENVPRVRRKNDHNLEQWLNELLAANDISLSFGETKFLYTEVKGNVFVTSYRTTLRVYEKNQERHTSSILVQVAGQAGDVWKVGQYNWVSFNY